MSTRAATRPVAARRGWLPKVLSYTGSSVVATACSAATFALLFGPLGVGPIWSSILSWLAGAIPNYWINRRWTWSRTGRPSLRGEVVPYATIVLLILLIATTVTRVVDHALQGSNVSQSAQVVLVDAAFVGVYVFMFVLRFFLLDRLFARLARTEAADPRGHHE